MKEKKNAFKTRYLIFRKFSSISKQTRNEMEQTMFTYTFDDDSKLFSLLLNNSSPPSSASELLITTNNKTRIQLIRETFFHFRRRMKTSSSICTVHFEKKNNKIILLIQSCVNISQNVQPMSQIKVKRRLSHEYQNIK